MICLYVESKKYNKLVNTTKKRQGSQIVVTRGDGGGAILGWGSWEVQTLLCREAIGMYCTAWGI